MNALNEDFNFAPSEAPEHQILAISEIMSFVANQVASTNLSFLFKKTAKTHCEGGITDRNWHKHFWILYVSNFLFDTCRIFGRFLTIFACVRTPFQPIFPDDYLLQPHGMNLKPWVFPARTQRYVSIEVQWTHCKSLGRDWSTKWLKYFMSWNMKSHWNKLH